MDSGPINVPSLTFLSINFAEPTTPALQTLCTLRKHILKRLGFRSNPGLEIEVYPNPISTIIGWLNLCAPLETFSLGNNKAVKIIAGQFGDRLTALHRLKELSISAGCFDSSCLSVLDRKINPHIGSLLTKLYFELSSLPLLYLMIIVSSRLDRVENPRSTSPRQFSSLEALSFLCMEYRDVKDSYR